MVPTAATIRYERTTEKLAHAFLTRFKIPGGGTELRRIEGSSSSPYNSPVPIRDLPLAAVAEAETGAEAVLGWYYL